MTIKTAKRPENSTAGGGAPGRLALLWQQLGTTLGGLTYLGALAYVATGPTRW